MRDIEDDVGEQTRRKLVKAVDRSGNVRLDQLPPEELLELARKGLIHLSPKAETTMKEIVKLARNNTNEEVEGAESEDESIVEEEEVPDSFRVLDSEGRPTGPSLG